MTCDTKKRQERASPEWTDAEVDLMEAEVKVARAKADREFLQRNPYSQGTREHVRAVEDAENKAREAAHDRHVLRMFKERAANPEGFQQKIPLDDWMAMHGHHTHDKTKT